MRARQVDLRRAEPGKMVSGTTEAFKGIRADQREKKEEEGQRTNTKRANIYYFIHDGWPCLQRASTTRKAGNEMRHDLACSVPLCS